MIEQLQRARHEAGDPSYATIAQRVSEIRVERGESPYAARVARSTVYDAFRPGRARVNVALLHDIALALGVTESEVEVWVAERDRRRIAPDGSATEAPPPSTAVVLLVLLGCLLLNVVGRRAGNALDLPIHLDMVGTAVAAIALGPWRGAAVGATTNLLGSFFTGIHSWPFALVNVVGALVWGYGVRRWGLGRSLPRFLALNLLVAVVCSVVALAVIAVLFGPAPEASGSELLGDLLVTTPAWVALGVSNLMISIGDKTISGFLALAVLAMLPVDVRAPLSRSLVGMLTDADRGRSADQSASAAHRPG